MIGVYEVKDFFIVHGDVKFKAKPMLIHLCNHKAIILYYTRKGRDFHTMLTVEDVLDMTTKEFKSYSSLAEYHGDAATGS
jgi:hypothetical protein